MTKIYRKALACLCALAAGPVAAQDTGWSFAATGYVWLPAVDSTLDTSLGTLDSSLSASNAIADLEFRLHGNRRGAARSLEPDRGTCFYTDISI